jgi:hypothetical protein
LSDTQRSDESIERIFNLLSEFDKLKVDNSFFMRLRRGVAYIIFPEAKRSILFMAKILLEWDKARDGMNEELARIKRKRDQEKTIHDRINVVMTRLQQRPSSGKVADQLRAHDLHLLELLVYGVEVSVISVPYGQVAPEPKFRRGSWQWADQLWLHEAREGVRTVRWTKEDTPRRRWVGGDLA